MLYAVNLPIAGNLPQNLPAEHRQRAQEFWALNDAIESGDLSGVQKALLLQQNTTNPLQTVRKYLQFGYDQEAAEQLLLLEQALLSGNLNAAHEILANLKKTVRKRSFKTPIAPDSAEPQDDAPSPIPNRQESSGRSLDTFA